MEILLATAVSIFLQIIKNISKKIGKEMTKNLVYILLFVFSLGIVILTEVQIISWDTINRYIQILLLAVGFYEGILKKLTPFIDKVFNFKGPSI